MQITVNGADREVADNCTVLALLEQLNAPPRGIAVARNDRVVPRSKFETEALREGDRIEIIKAVAGG
jgi:sulfur carrier protein